MVNGESEDKPLRAIPLANLAYEDTPVDVPPAERHKASERHRAQAQAQYLLAQCSFEARARPTTVSPPMRLPRSPRNSTRCTGLPSRSSLWMNSSHGRSTPSLEAANPSSIEPALSIRFPARS